MRVVVRSGGRLLTFEAPESTPVTRLLVALEAILGVPRDKQQLIRKGKIVEASRTLHDSGVTNGTTLMLVGAPTLSPTIPEVPAVIDLTTLPIPNEPLPRSADEIFSSFKSNLMRLQLQFPRPSVPQNPTSSDLSGLLIQGSRALDELRAVCDGHLFELGQSPVGPTPSILGQFEHFAETFCAHLQVNFFDRVVTSDEALVVQRQQLNRNISTLLRAFSLSNFQESVNAQG
eukprot:c11264_g1_i1.p1 GENE.c11264_g1_i1~~c11264_g1_i1.p1  ORF type:complete len:231 (+),score=43.31 c11264_g1_i1:43-735(+)